MEDTSFNLYDCCDTTTEKIKGFTPLQLILFLTLVPVVLISGLYGIGTGVFARFTSEMCNELICVFGKILVGAFSLVVLGMIIALIFFCVVVITFLVRRVFNI